MKKRCTLVSVALAMVSFFIFFSGCSNDGAMTAPTANEQELQSSFAPGVGDIVGLEVDGSVRYFSVTHVRSAEQGRYVLSCVCVDKASSEEPMRAARADTTRAPDKGEGDPKPQMENVTWGDLKGTYR